MKKLDQYSDQGAKIVSENYEMLRPNEHYGRRRVHFFEITVPTGAVASDEYGLVKIPAGARILGAEILSASESGQTVDIGLNDFNDSGFLDGAGTVPDDNQALASSVALAATKVQVANSKTLYYGYVTEKPLWVVLTDIDGFTPGSTISGSIEIAVD